MRPHGYSDLNEGIGPCAGVLGVVQWSPFLVKVAIWGGGEQAKGQGRQEECAGRSWAAIGGVGMRGGQP